MSMELPVVSTKSGGMEEVIEHGKDGLLCEVYNAKDIAEKLNLIANDYETRKQLGIQARKKVLQDFTLQRQVNVFEEQYYRLINN
jgi:colanic acid/amylovoran biosynthesis glycosyltransferase